MNTQFVSSMIKEGNYDAKTKCLTISFNKGGTFIYSGVPPEVWQGMLDAESVGKYFLAHVKGKYPATAAPVNIRPSDYPVRGETVTVAVTDANSVDYGISDNLEI